MPRPAPTQLATVRAVLLVLARVLLIRSARCDDNRPLRNAHLRCCTVLTAPYTVKSRRYHHGIGGLSIEYLNLLSERTGLTCRSLVPYEDDSGVAWNALLENIVNCTESDGSIRPHKDCQCDIGVGAWFQTADRLAIDFLPPFVYDARHVVVHVEDTSFSSSGDFFLTTFTPVVWGLLVVLILLFSVLKLLDRRFAPQEKGGVEMLPGDKRRFRQFRRFVLKNRAFFRMRRAVQSVLSQVIGQNTMRIEGDFGSTRQWVLNYTVALCGLFLVLVYESTMMFVFFHASPFSESCRTELARSLLTSCSPFPILTPSLCVLLSNSASLVQETLQSKFRSIEDIKSCEIPDRDICFVSGDATQHFWDSTIADTRCRKYAPTSGSPQTYETYEEALAQVAARRCKFMITDGATAMTATNGRYCQKLALTGRKFTEGGLSFVLPKGSEYFTPLRKATLELQGEMLIDSLDRYYEKNGQCILSGSPRLTFSKLKTFFVVAFVAIILLFLEMVVDPQTNSRGATRNEEEGEAVTDEASPSSKTKAISMDGSDESYSDLKSGDV